MANGSEYRLNLKAVLDTSQVQQELDKLKRGQQAQQGGGGASSAGGGGERFSANFSKLDQTLQRLNQSVQRLQRSVEQLNRGNQKAVQQVQSSGAGMNGAASTAAIGNIVPGLNRNAVQRNWLASKGYFQRNEEAIQLYRPMFESGGEIAKWLKRHGYGTLRFMDRMAADPDLRGEPSLAGKLEAYDRQKIAYNEQLQRRLDADRISRRGSIKAGRVFAGLIGGQLVGGAADIATDLGYSKTGIILDAASSGIQSGIGTGSMISMAGGGNPYAILGGVVVGLGVAAYKSVSGLDKLAQASTSAAEGLRKVGEGLVRISVDQAQQRYAFMQQHKATLAFDAKDQKLIERNAEKFKRKYDQARTKYFEMEGPDELAKRVMDEAYEKKKAVNFDSDKSQEIQKAANEELSAYQLKFDAARKEMEQAKQLWDLWKGVGEELKRMEELERKQLEAKRKSATDDAATFARKAIGAGQINATERFMVDVMHDRKKSPLTQFTMIGKELDDLREQRNKKLEEAYGLNRQIQKEASTAKPERLDELSKARGLAMEQADFLDRRIDVLEGALKDITSKVTPPDFSHMTSLAQYGFNMGEKDNTEKVMEDYYGKMTDLTKQIRDKLDQGIKTQATYSE